MTTSVGNTHSPERTNVRKHFAFLKRLHPFISIRTLLPLSTVLLILFVGVSTIITSYILQSQGLHSIASQYQNSMNSRIESFTSNFFSEHYDTLKSLRSILSSLDDFDDFFGWGHVKSAEFLLAFASPNFRITGGIMLGSKTGSFVLHNGNGFYYTTNGSQIPTYLYYGLYDQEERAVNLSQIGPYNVTQRPWYASCEVNAMTLYEHSIDNASAPLIQRNSIPKEASLSIFVSQGLKRKPEMTLSVPFFDSQNSFRGILTYVINLPAISEYLETLQSSSEMYLMIDPEGYLIAWSKGTVISPSEARILAKDHPNDLVRGFNDALVREFGNNYEGLGFSEPNDHFNAAKLDKLGYLLSVTKFTVFDMPIIAIVAIQDDTVYGQARAMYLLSGGIVAVLIVLSTIGSLIFGYCAIRPLLFLSREMEKARKLQLESIKRMKRFPLLFEYFKIAQSFQKLVSTLEEYRGFLPDYVIPSSSSLTNSDEHPKYTKVEEFVMEMDPNNISTDDLSTHVSSVCEDVESPSPLGTPNIRDNDKSFFRGSSQSKLGPSLSVDKIGFMILRIHNAARLIASDGSEFLRQYEIIVDIVGTVMSSCKGTIQSMEQDRISMTFTHQNIALRLTKMIDAAFYIQAKMRDTGETRISNVSPVRFSLSLCHGVLRYGVIGSKKNRCYSVNGVPKDNCWLSCVAADRLQAKVVCDSEIYDFICKRNHESDDQKIFCAQVDVIQGINGQEHTVHSVKERLILRDAEWMYTLNLKQVSMAQDKMREAFNALMDKKIEKAHALYTEVKELRPRDGSVTRLLALCNEWSKENDLSPREWIMSQTESSANSDGKSLLQKRRRMRMGLADSQENSEASGCDDET